MQVISGPQAGRKFTFDKHDTLPSAGGSGPICNSRRSIPVSLPAEVNLPVCYLMISAAAMHAS
jgi:hypothetical protein